jgi:membrane associated rhomboid family serine protease
MTDAPRPDPPKRPLPPLVRPSLWPRPGLRDITQAATGSPAAATAIRAREWELVLAARGIPHAIRRQGGGYRLLVPRRRAEEALAELADYADERTSRPLPDPGAEPVRPTVWLLVLAVMGLVAGVWGILLGRSQLFGRLIDWRAIGAGDSTRMLAGQWYRAATSLCLHTDPAHLLGNAASGALFVSLLGRETGAGLAFFLAVAAGVAGNLLKVAVQGPGMHFLGASTAVFGALGALGGVRLAHRWPPLTFRRSAPAGAALMLLAMLGAGGEEAGPVDLAGHLFGFVAGACLGLAAGFAVKRLGRPVFAAQAVFAAVALGVVVWAFAVAVAG